MDTATGDIRAVEFTSSREGDSPVLPDLLVQIPEDEEIGVVTGDGAFDTRRCHSAIRARWHRGSGIPSDRWQSSPRSHPQKRPPLEGRLPRRLGRTIWKRWSGYHVRGRMRNLKSFGEQIASRDPDRQTAETHIRVALMNRFNALATAQIERVA